MHTTILSSLKKSAFKFRNIIFTLSLSRLKKFLWKILQTFTREKLYSSNTPARWKRERRQAKEWRNKILQWKITVNGEAIRDVWIYIVLSLFPFFSRRKFFSNGSPFLQFTTYSWLTVKQVSESSILAHFQS